MSDAVTLRVYAQKADEYAAISSDSPEENAILTRFINALPQGGRVLDLGCGPGHYAAKMAEAGLLAEATDAVAEMVALAKQQTGVTAWQSVFDDLDAQARYDGVFANFSLLHAPRTDLPRHLAAIYRALKPGGVFHIGMKTGSEELRDRLGRQYTYVTRDGLADLLTGAGFTLGFETTGQGKGLDGSVAPWVVMHARA